MAEPIIAVSERSNLPFTFGILEAEEYNAYALPGDTFTLPVLIGNDGI